jgi:hypothetical protein
VQAGDAGDDRVAAMADLLGLKAGDPTALLFVESLEQQVHLLVQEPIGMVTRVEAN